MEETQNTVSNIEIFRK